MKTSLLALLLYLTGCGTKAPVPIAAHWARHVASFGWVLDYYARNDTGQVVAEISGGSDSHYWLTTITLCGEYRTFVFESEDAAKKAVEKACAE